MSRDLCVSKRSNGTWRLFYRDWAFQGDRPDYTTIKTITEQEAISLVKTNIAVDLFGHIEELEKKNVEGKTIN